MSDGDPDYGRARLADDASAENPEVVLTAYVYPTDDDLSYPDAIEAVAEEGDAEIVDAEVGPRTYEGVRSGQQFHLTLDVDAPAAGDAVVVSFRVSAFSVALAEVEVPA